MITGDIWQDLQKYTQDIQPGVRRDRFAALVQEVRDLEDELQVLYEKNDELTTELAQCKQEEAETCSKT